MQTRYKWKDPGKKVELNAMVILMEDNTSPLKWPMGRIIHTYPGPDGEVKVVLVKTQTELGPSPSQQLTEEFSTKSSEEIAPLVISWLADINEIRAKSGNMNCMLSGRMKRRIEILKDMINIFTSKLKETGDLSYLRLTVAAELKRKVQGFRERIGSCSTSVEVAPAPAKRKAGKAAKEDSPPRPPSSKKKELDDHFKVLMQYDTQIAEQMQLLLQLREELHGSVGDRGGRGVWSLSRLPLLLSHVAGPGLWRIPCWSHPGGIGDGGVPRRGKRRRNPAFSLFPAGATLAGRASRIREPEVRGEAASQYKKKGAARGTSGHTAWVQCPLAAANSVAAAGYLRLGWTMVRVELLRSRPTQCFKCWHFGHVRSKCTATVDRDRNCFRVKEQRTDLARPIARMGGKGLGIRASVSESRARAQWVHQLVIDDKTRISRSCLVLS
ncbi:hypothetical protein DMN91_012153 [Ooceraea biroi]|uniref:DUF5641 domain-containing protein n=1 Tax=Ooceraea biroi TaxID=2015173 RepID=A0A3L8D4I9_OOCBI|nr:hypothetical protein DMN91_012153 [Ooceraea biroi]